MIYVEIGAYIATAMGALFLLAYGGPIEIVFFVATALLAASVGAGLGAIKRLRRKN